METRERVLELKRTLIQKRGELEKNPHSLKMFGPKDIPLAVYDFVIQELGGIADDESEKTKVFKS